MEIVQAVKKLNSISRERLNFRRRPILCTTLHRSTQNCVLLCIETLCKRATSVVHLINFSFEFFLWYLYSRCLSTSAVPWCSKSKLTKNTNQGWSCLKQRLHPIEKHAGRKFSHFGKLFTHLQRGPEGLTPFSQLSASDFKRCWGSDKCGAVFRSINDLPACFCKGTIFV